MRRFAVAGAAAVSAALILPATAAATDIDEVAAGITQAQIDAATKELTARTTRLEIGRFITPVAVETVKGGTHATTLQADVLFDFGSAEMDARARSAVEGAIEKAPRGGEVTVDGYTDSIGADAANQSLSERRAKAVGAVITAERADLVLTEAGHGESDPVAPNTRGGKDDPAGRAKNRRVVVSYEG